MSKILLKYIPEAALPMVASWLRKYHLHLRITKSRKSKLGDFRPDYGGKPPRISVNGDLNQYHFLITLVHEIAHAAVWEKYKNRVQPHGKEWQSIYTEKLKSIKKEVEFPEELQAVLERHLARPKASSCSDPMLYRALKNLDTKQSTLLEDIEMGTHFRFREKRIFKKGAKRRSRFECIELKSKRLYLISGLAEIEVLEN